MIGSVEYGSGNVKRYAVFLMESRMLNRESMSGIAVIVWERMYRFRILNAMLCRKKM